MPIKEPGEQDHERACGSGQTSRLLHPFLKQSELFAKKQVLGDDGGAGGKEQADKQEQATFYRSLRHHLRPSERPDLFLRRTADNNHRENPDEKRRLNAFKSSVPSQNRSINSVHRHRVPACDA
jgi:hypothetical protein